MRALQVSKFYPPVMGGIESVAYELTEGLNRAGVRTDVLCSSQTRRDRLQHLASGYDVQRCASWGTLLSTSVAPAMRRHLRRMAEGCDVVHVHMPDPMAALSVWSVRPRAKLLVHWHSDVIRQRIALRLYEPLQRWMLERADAIIATSEPYADASLALRPWRSKVAVVPIGISDHKPVAPGNRAAALRKRFGGRRIVFSLGRMTYYKGFEVLIEAAASLPEDSVVLIGGDGELLERHRDQVRERGLQHKVHFLGHIRDDHLSSHYEACDVFCMSSTVRAEAYGVAIVEAMAMGKPIVATDIPGSGVPWVNVNGTTGFNVPVRNPGALASALGRLLEDAALRARLGGAARERYLAEFGAELMTRRTIDLYRRVTAQSVSL